MGLLAHPAREESLLWRLRGLIGVAAVFAAVLLLRAVLPYLPEYPRAPFVVRSETGEFRVVTMTHRLAQPWGLAFLPDGDMLITERRGRLRLIHEGKLVAGSIAGVPAAVTVEQAGLMDIAIHPRFAENRFVYLTYSKPGPRGDTPSLWRARLEGRRLVDGRDIFVSNAWSPSGGNNGSRIAFGPDGLMYMTIGDRHDRTFAQDLRSDKGKIIRLKDDGTVPDDNPFLRRPDALPEIYAYGIRTPQGLAFDPQTNILYETEHGPRGGDEINRVLSGHNYGWPIITYGKNYDGTIITKETSKPGMDQPLAYWVPSIGPSGLTFYMADKFPAWRGNAFAGAMIGTHLRRLVFDGERIVKQEELLTSLHARIRDVRQGPDGLLYLLTDHDPGSLLRLEPAGR